MTHTWDYRKTKKRIILHSYTILLQQYYYIINEERSMHKIYKILSEEILLSSGLIHAITDECSSEAIMLRLKGLTSVYKPEWRKRERERERGEEEELGNWREDEDKQCTSRLDRDLFA